MDFSVFGGVKREWPNLKPLGAMCGLYLLTTSAKEKWRVVYSFGSF